MTLPEIGFLPWGLALVALVLYAAGVVALAMAGRHQEARALAGFVPDCLVLARRLVADPATPRAEKWLLAGLAVYLASPVDIVPDFVPVAGQLDDAVLVALALRHLVRRHGTERVRAAWPGPESSLRAVLRLAGTPG